MKKLLTSSILGGLFLPALAFAAYNDVTLTSSVTMTGIDGQTVNISGDANVVEQMVVNTGSITFTLDTNSEVTVTSPSNKKLEHNAANAHVVLSICESGNSQIHLKGAADDIGVTITAKNTTCPEGSGSGGSSGGGGGGGGGGVAVAVAAQTQYATKEAHIQAIVQAIAVLQAQIAALTGAPAAQVSAISGKITSPLSSGSRGSSVKTLQQFLNTHGFAVASSGPGSPGNETETFGSLTLKAVEKFQEQYNIAKPGVPGYGNVGPKTRAKINELSGN